MSNWISIKDSLPENGVDVLLRHLEGHTSDMCVGQRDDYYSQDRGGVGWSVPSPLVGAKVTHWMKLPDPPTDHDGPYSPKNIIIRCPSCMFKFFEPKTPNGERPGAKDPIHCYCCSTKHERAEFEMDT